MSALLALVRNSSERWGIPSPDIQDMGTWAERDIRPPAHLSDETDETGFIEANLLPLTDNRRQGWSPATQARPARRPDGRATSNGAPEAFPSTSRDADVQERGNRGLGTRTAPPAADSIRSDDASDTVLSTLRNTDCHVGRRLFRRANGNVNSSDANGSSETSPPPPPQSTSQDGNPRQRRHSLPHVGAASRPVASTSNGANGATEPVRENPGTRHGRRPAPRPRLALDTGTFRNEGPRSTPSADLQDRSVHRSQLPEAQGQVTQLRNLNRRVRDGRRLPIAGVSGVVRKTRLSVAEAPPGVGRDPRHKLLYYLSCVKRAVNIEPLVVARDVKHLDLSRLDTLHFTAMGTLEVHELVDLCRLLSPENLADVMLVLVNSGLEDKEDDRLVVYVNCPMLRLLRKTLSIAGVSVPILRSMAVTPGWLEHFYKPVEGFDQWVSSGWYSVGLKVEPANRDFLDIGAKLWDWGKAISGFLMLIVGVVVLFIITLPRI